MAKKVQLKTADYEYGVIRIRDKETGKIRTSRGNGDAVHRALALHIANGGSLNDVAKANDVKGISKGGNPGMASMNLGTALRGLVRNEQKVKIGSVSVTDLKQKDPVLPKIEPLTRAKPAKKAKAKKAKKARRSTASRATASSAPAEAAA
jgi:hypothetical protein